MSNLSKLFDPLCSLFSHFKINKKTLAIITLMFFLLSLIPIFIMSFYCVASADDFKFGILTHQAWEESHSLIKVMGAAFASVVHYYFNWQGFFTSNFVPSLNPFIFDEGLYFITTFISVIVFVSGFFYLSYQILKRYFKSDFYDIILVVCPILFMFFQLMPSSAEWLFWFDAGQALIYYGLIGFLIGIILKCSAKNKASIISIILSILISIVLSGTDSSSTFLLIFMFFKIINDIFLNKKSTSVICMNLLVFSFVLIGMIICLIAPGNDVRVHAEVAKGVVGMPFIQAIIMSFYYSFVFIATNNNIIAIITLILILSPIAMLLVKKSSFSFKYPVFVFILSYCIYASRFFNTLYSQSSLGGIRHKNGYFIFEILFFAVNVFYFWGWIFKKSSDKNVNQFIANGLTEYIKRYSVVYVIVVISVIGLAFLQFGFKETTSVSCSLSIVSGEAHQYKKEMDERLDMYLDDSVKDVKVSPLTSVPYVFIKDEVTDDPNDWRNRRIAEYYNKDIVVLEEQ